MPASLADRFAGRACYECGARRDILAVFVWQPAVVYVAPWGTQRWPARLSGSAHCFDREACRERTRKRSERASARAACIVLVEPKAPDAKVGTCRWCGEPIYKVRPRLDWQGERDRRRSYHHGPERGEPDCKREWDASRVWDARSAVEWLAEQAGEALRCVDCGAACGERGVSWEADHEVALEDGGEHVLGNLRCRCCPCHRRKTSRENAARAALRRGVGS